MVVGTSRICIVRATGSMISCMLTFIAVGPISRIVAAVICTGLNCWSKKYLHSGGLRVRVEAREISCASGWWLSRMTNGTTGLITTVWIYRSWKRIKGPCASHSFSSSSSRPWSYRRRRDIGRLLFTAGFLIHLTPVIRVLLPCRLCKILII